MEHLGHLQLLLLSPIQTQHIPPPYVFNSMTITHPQCWSRHLSFILTHTFISHIQTAAKSCHFSVYNIAKIQPFFLLEENLVCGLINLSSWFLQPSPHWFLLRSSSPSMAFKALSDPAHTLCPDLQSLPYSLSPTRSHSTMPPSLSVTSPPSFSAVPKSSVLFRALTLSVWLLQGSILGDACKDITKTSSGRMWRLICWQELAILSMWLPYCGSCIGR